MVPIIDEVSTLPAAVVDRLVSLLRVVRSVQVLFGGAGTIFCCDVLQVSPHFGNFAFTSSVWWKASGNKVVRLTTTNRQVEDPVLRQFLLRIRVGSTPRRTSLYWLPGER